MVNENILEEAYEKAKETVKICSTKYGLYASGGKKGYHGVWARDSMITLIGASTDSNIIFKTQFKKSLITLEKYQSKMGQIPNAILKLDAKKPQVDFKSLDSSLWFVIGEYFYKKRYREANLFNQHKDSIKKVINWISYKDIGEDVTIEQLPTTDWEDAFPEKFGDVMSTQALYYKVLSLINDKKRMKRLKFEINKNPENNLWNGNYYWAYRWKNHNKYKEIGEWFDSFGNILAILFDFCDKKMSKKIIKYVKEKNINHPYPLKAIDPPITTKSKYWKDYYYDAKATPHHYLNGGIWSYLGGFYVLALIKLKMFSEAEKELKKLAEGNTKENIFPEWIDPISKETHGLYQAWSAGMYMWAYNSLKKKMVL
jgi:hypothetical protein